MMVGENVISFSEIDSTNRFAVDNLDRLPSGTVVWALSQTDGYGRHKRVWHSSKGGLWFSIVFKPTLIREPNEYTKIASVAIAETLLQLDFKSVRIKWPNDVLIDNRKVAGVLTEAVFTGRSLNAIVVGIGINVNNEMPDEIKQTGISLSAVKGDHISLESLLDRLLKRIEFLERPTLSEEKNRISHKTLEEIPAFAENDEITVSLHKDDKVTGIIKSITPSSLLIEQESGTVIEIKSGEVIL